MKAYLITVFILSIVTLIILVIADSQKSTKPYVSFLTGLITVLLLISPLFKILSVLTNDLSLPLPEVTEIQFESEYDDMLEKAEVVVGEKIKLLVFEKFSIHVKQVRVSLKCDSERNIFYIERIQVVIDDESMILTVNEYLNGEFSAEIVVEVSDIDS